MYEINKLNFLREVLDILDYEIVGEGPEKDGARAELTTIREHLRASYPVGVTSAPLTIRELRDAMEGADLDLAIWVKTIPDDIVSIAITDIVPRKGVVAIWGSGAALSEKDYGKKWVAYLRDPR